VAVAIHKSVGWSSMSLMVGGVGWGGGKGDEGEQGKGREGSGVLLKSLK
jgi:hypothetical protein